MQRIRFTLLVIGLVLVPAIPDLQGEPVELHPLHVSYCRMVLEDDLVVLNVRIFTDDLENALGLYHNIQGLKMRPDPEVDSLFTSYFNAKFTLSVGDSILPGVIAESGESDDMWWYIMLYQGWEPINAISFRTELLYDLFDDQRNITRILHTASDKYQMYYSVAGAVETEVFSAEN